MASQKRVQGSLNPRLKAGDTSAPVADRPAEKRTFALTKPATVSNLVEDVLEMLNLELAKLRYLQTSDELDLPRLDLAVKILKNLPNAAPAASSEPQFGSRLEHISEADLDKLLEGA